MFPVVTLLFIFHSSERKLRLVKRCALFCNVNGGLENLFQVTQGWVSEAQPHIGRMRTNNFREKNIEKLVCDL